MLRFFMFFLMTVSSTPLGLVHGKQASKDVAEMMSHPHLSEALFQNKTFLSELAEADPETLNTILGLLNGLLDVSEAASVAFTTDVIAALNDKNTKSGILAEATSNQTKSNTAKTAADLAVEVAQGAVITAQGAVITATSEFEAADVHHTAMVDELNDKQPVMDAESETLRSTIVLVESLLPAGRICSYGSSIQNTFSTGSYAVAFADGNSWSSFHSFEEAKSLCTADTECTRLFWYNMDGGSYSAGGKYQLGRGTQSNQKNDWDMIPATC